MIESDQIDLRVEKSVDEVYQNSEKKLKLEPNL